jgi:predicted ATPase/DNA-binding SARP family transcriptional activator
MALLRVWLLGGLTLSWDETPVPAIPGMAARSLFAYLLTYRERSHTRDLLAGIFWPDLPEATARRRLSRALWQIRRSLRVQDRPQPVLLTDGDTVQINPDLPLWLDVEKFRHQAAKGDLQELELAVGLYQGDFLAGYYDDWLLVQREQLQEMFLSVLERLVEGYKSRGEYERALTHARRLATKAPWREKVHREVMRLCHLLGRDNEALKQFEICRQNLTEELDAEPSLNTVALVREIAAYSGQPPTFDLPKAPLQPGSIVLDGAEAVELPLVGRERERRELLAHVEALFQGLGGLVLLEGEAGVGKTRLLRTVAHDAEWRGAQVLWGEAQEMGDSVPYGPLTEALASGLSPLRANQLAQLVDRIWQQVLAPLLPTLATCLPDLAQAPQLDPARERARLVAALAHFLAGWRRIKPLVVVLENLHWMGEDMLDTLARLAPSLREGGVLIVGSFRGEDARAVPTVWQKLQALDRAGVQRRLVLNGLDAAETGELVRRSLGLGLPVPLFESRLYEETRGNPLFVLETLRALYGEGFLARDADGRWSTPWDETTSDYAELPLPQAVEQTIARRLAFLSPTPRQMVHLAAVLGERFDFDLLLAASDQESPSVLATLGELVQCRFLDETERDYRFSHDKVRQVAYDGLAARECLQLHRQVACALEAVQPDRVAALAHHWTQAEVWDKAAGYHRQAGDRARAVYANTEAANHYSQALAVLKRWSGAEALGLKVQVHLAREAVYEFLSRREAQAKDLAALDVLVEELDDKAQKAQIALRQGMYADTSGDFPAAIKAAQQAIGLARAAQDVRLEAEGHRQWGRILIRQGLFQAARSQIEAALALARHHALRSVEAESLCELGTISGRQSAYDQALKHYEQALHILHDLGDRQGEGKVLNNLGLVARHLGDYAAARAYHERSRCIRREIGDWPGEVRVLNNLGIICRHQGDYARARLYFEQVLAFQREIGERWYEGRVLDNLGMALLNLGDYANAKSCFEQSLHINREIYDWDSEAVSLEGLSWVFHHWGDDQAARQYLLEALRIARDRGDRDSQQFSLTCLGHVLAGLGHLAEAADAYLQALSLQRALGKPHMTMEPLAGLARLFLAQGDLAQAQIYNSEVLAYLDRGGGLDGIEQPFQVYLTCFQVLLAHDDPRAEAILDTAYHLLQERAAWIEDRELLRSFLENVSAHREIIAAHHKFPGWQQRGQVQVRLPRADAPTGRPLRDDEYVIVTWTVAARSDDEIQSKNARRRHRIIRLLAEAQNQDAVPRDRDFAEVLGVSLPSLRRDMAALADGHDLLTRGRK